MNDEATGNSDSGIDWDKLGALQHEAVGELETLFGISTSITDATELTEGQYNGYMLRLNVATTILSFRNPADLATFIRDREEDEVEVEVPAAATA